MRRIVIYNNNNNIKDEINVAVDYSPRLGIIIITHTYITAAAVAFT